MPENWLLDDKTEGLRRTQQKLAETISHLRPKLISKLSTPEKSQKNVLGFISERTKAWKSRALGLPLSPDIVDMDTTTEDIKTTNNAALSSDEEALSWSGSSTSDLNDRVQDFSGEPSHQQEELEMNADSPALSSIVNVILECFEFKEHSTFLKRNLASMLLSRQLGGDAEQVLKEGLKNILRDDALEQFMIWLSENDSRSLNAWLYTKDDVKSAKQSRIELRNKLVCFYNIFSDFVGFDATNTGLFRLFEMIQNETLNKHLLYTLFDAFLALCDEHYLKEL